MALCEKKTNKLWLLKALDRGTRKTVAWVLGARDSSTFAKLYDKVKHLEKCVFYTDRWNAFAEILPAERHVAGKTHTVMIERDNSNTRHHLGRFTRRTKVVSKKDFMVDYSIRIWRALQILEIFAKFQTDFSSIFK